MTKKSVFISTFLIILLALCGASNLMLHTFANASNTFYHITPTENAQSVKNTETDKIIESIIQRKALEFGADKLSLLSSNKFLQHAGLSSADWLTFALARYGFNGDYNYYIGFIDQLITERAMGVDQFKSVYPSDWQRVALTIAASGGNPAAIGLTRLGEFINIYERAYYNVSIKMLDTRGASAWIWTLLTVGALALPDKDGCELSRDILLENISRLSHADGGFGVGEKSDADVTCMAITALSFFKDEKRLYGGKSVSAIIENALTYLEGQISEQATLSSYGVFNAPSTAWGLIALSALGCVDDARFVKGEKTLQDGLVTFYINGGGFSNAADGQFDSRATEQALYALIAAQRYHNGMPSLFNLSNKNDLIISSGLTQNDRIEAANLINLPQNTGLFFKASRLLYLIMRQADYAERNADLASVNNTIAMIIEIEREIRSINQSIEQLIPIKKLRAKDKPKIDTVLRQIDRLSDFDSNRIVNYEQLLQAKVRVENLRITGFVTFCLIAALIAVALALVISKTCRKSKI